MTTKCLARQHSDQMICHQCGLVWDMNDPEPPDCLREVNAAISPDAQDQAITEYYNDRANSGQAALAK